MNQPEKIKIKRIYKGVDPSDGMRILVDRLWPRGMSRERAAIDWWAKPLSPSSELRRWYGHRRQLWSGFKEKYFSELDGKKESVEAFLQRTEGKVITLLFSCREEELNNAVALREYLQVKLNRTADRRVLNI